LTAALALREPFLSAFLPVDGLVFPFSAPLLFFAIYPLLSFLRVPGRDHGEDISSIFSGIFTSQLNFS
jgi:hypothetical protein